MYEWPILVVGDVEAAKVAVEMPCLFEVDKPRDTIEVIKVENLEAVPTFQQSPTGISPSTAG